MDPSSVTLAQGTHATPRFQLRVWHLALLVLYVAIATVDIRDQTRREPFLMALATAGFAGYALLGWLGWGRFRRLESASRRDPPRSSSYMVAMAAFFLVATAVLPRPRVRLRHRRISQAEPLGGHPGPGGLPAILVTGADRAGVTGPAGGERSTSLKRKRSPRAACGGSLAARELLLIPLWLRSRFAPTLVSGVARQRPFFLWCILPAAKPGARGLDLVIGDLPCRGHPPWY